LVQSVVSCGIGGPACRGTNEKRVNKKAFIYTLLACVLAWLGLSYAPGLQARLPALAFSAAWHSALLWAGMLAVLVFLGIQIWLVGSTLWSLRVRKSAAWDGARSKSPAPARQRVSLSAEAIWTALPILMTVLLALAGHRIWSALN
jgi:heme/copper-type cytochrome/quinol oxidase subunit 2